MPRTTYRKNCKVCSSHYKQEVQNQYLKLGWSGDQIHTWLTDEAGVQIARSSLFNHLARHAGERLGLRVQHARQSAEIQKMLDDGSLPEVSTREFLEEVVRVGMLKAADATPSEAVHAAKIRWEMQEEEKNNFLDRISRMICARGTERKNAVVEPKQVRTRTEEVELVKTQEERNI